RQPMPIATQVRLLISRASTQRASEGCAPSNLVGRMSTQYVFSMYRLTKRYPPDKVVLENISISLLPGAKIGVLGYNGAGKSTLLRILAGLDTEFEGEAQLAPGATVGLLEQEPSLNSDKDVRGNVEEGLAEVRGLLDRLG